MPIRPCKVTFHDDRGVLHSTQVFAESVMEAAALALRSFREQGAVDNSAVFDLRVEIITKTTHTVPLSKLQAWLDSAGPDPKTHAIKVRSR